MAHKKWEKNPYRTKHPLALPSCNKWQLVIGNCSEQVTKPQKIHHHALSSHKKNCVSCSPLAGGYIVFLFLHCSFYRFSITSQSSILSMTIENMNQGGPMLFWFHTFALSLLHYLKISDSSLKPWDFLSLILFGDNATISSVRKM